MRFFKISGWLAGLFLLWPSLTSAQELPNVLGLSFDNTPASINFQDMSDDPNIFKNGQPDLTITKPDSWNFTSNSTTIAITPSSASLAASVAIEIITIPYLVDAQNAFSAWKNFLADYGVLGVLTFIDQGAKPFGGRTADHLIYDRSAEEQAELDGELGLYLVPLGNHLLVVTYSYDSQADGLGPVQLILNRMQIRADTLGTQESYSFSSGVPAMRLAPGNDWPMVSSTQALDYAFFSAADGIIMTSKSRPYLFASLSVIDLTCDDICRQAPDPSQQLETMTADDFWLNYGDRLAHLGQFFGDLSYEVKAKEQHRSVNGQLPDVVFQTAVANQNNEVLLTGSHYVFRSADRLVSIFLKSFNPDWATFEQDRLYFESSVLGQFQLGDAISWPDKLPVEIPVPTVPELQIPEQPGNTPEIGPVEQPYDSEAKAQITVRNRAMLRQLAGRILLKVEDKGRAYYVNPVTNQGFFLGRGQDAYEVMRREGVGIKTKDLAEIPVGLLPLSGSDTDNDGLTDDQEKALGTKFDNADSDSDSYTDLDEVQHDYDPLGIGKMKYDNVFGGRQKGKIFLQVEAKGEAWYVNPADGRRYYLGRADDAYQIMRKLSLGISNKDFLALEQTR